MKLLGKVKPSTEILSSSVNTYVDIIIVLCMDGMNRHCHCRTAKH